MTKMSKSNRRSKKEIEDSAIAAMERLVPEFGFNNLSLLTLIKEAGMDHNVFYRNFGTLDELFDKFVKKYDFWLNDKVDISQIQTLGDRKFMINLLQIFYRELENSEVMQKILIWELEDTSPITRTSANLRENLNMNITVYLEDVFKDSKLDISAINSIITSGIYYTVLHRKVSTFCGINYNLATGRKRVLKAIEDLINLTFDKLDEQNKQNSIIRMMANDGIEHAKIAKYFSLSAIQLKKVLSR